MRSSNSFAFFKLKAYAKKGLLLRFLSFKSEPHRTPEVWSQTNKGIFCFHSVDGNNSSTLFRESWDSKRGGTFKTDRKIKIFNWPWNGQRSSRSYYKPASIECIIYLYIYHDAKPSGTSGSLFHFRHLSLPPPKLCRNVSFAKFDEKGNIENDSCNALDLHKCCLTIVVPANVLGRRRK